MKEMASMEWIWLWAELDKLYREKVTSEREILLLLCPTEFGGGHYILSKRNFTQPEFERFCLNDMFGH